MLLSTMQCDQCQGRSRYVPADDRCHRWLAKLLRRHGWKFKRHSLLGSFHLCPDCSKIPGVLGQMIEARADRVREGERGK